MRFVTAICLSSFALASPCWAQITQASLTSGNGADASSFTTASVTPTANRLIIVAVAQGRGVDGTAAPTLSGNSLTWVQIATIEYQLRRRVTMFRSMGASPTTGAITIDFAGAAQKNCGWSVYEFAGIDTTGTNGSGAVVQSATNSATATSLTVTLAAFGSATNGATSAFSHAANELSTPDTGWTEIHDFGMAAPANSLETQWRADQDTTAFASWTTSAAAGGIAIEIKEAAAVAARRMFLVN